MGKESVYDRLSERINKEINFYGGELPDDVALAWDGYLSGIFEWDIIDLNDYDNLIKLLPRPSKNPVYSIFMGEPGIHLTLDSEN